MHRRAQVPALSLAVASTALAPVRASGQASDDWKWQAAVYGYLPDIGGTTRFPVSGSGSGVTVDAEKIVDSLKFTFMGPLEGRRGSWGVFTDVIYMDGGGHLPAVRGREGARGLVFGTRLLDIDQALRCELSGIIGSRPLPGRTAQSEVSLSNWDANVGARRYLDDDVKSGKKIESMTFNGPAIAAVFHW
jgi:hypothetical protein